MDKSRRGSDLRPLSRRQLLHRAAGGVATLVISRVLPACASPAGQVDLGVPGCYLTAALTEGPFFVDERLNRSDIRSDPESGDVASGAPLALGFTVERLVNDTCTPLSGAYLDVWHADAAGVYSDVPGAGVGRRFLRGYQLTDVDGVARFTTIYPGWYPGRAVHIHFKLRLFTGGNASYEFTSQLFFDEAVTTAVHLMPPYSVRGSRSTLNTSDGIYNSLSPAQREALTLRPMPDGADGYAGSLNLHVRLE